jgi:hypothetical protein
MKHKELNIDQMLELARGHAETVLRMGMQIMPVFALQGPGGLSIHGCPWKNDEEKEMMGTGIRQEIKRQKISRYSFTCEAWALELKSSEEFHLRPSKDPRRIEVVIVLAVDRHQRIFRQWKIERDAQGRFTELTPSKQEKGAFESWMADLLKEDQ